MTAARASGCCAPHPGTADRQLAGSANAELHPRLPGLLVCTHQRPPAPAAAAAISSERPPVESLEELFARPRVTTVTTCPHPLGSNACRRLCQRCWLWRRQRRSPASTRWRPRCWPTPRLPSAPQRGRQRRDCHPIRQAAGGGAASGEPAAAPGTTAASAFQIPSRQGPITVAAAGTSAGCGRCRTSSSCLASASVSAAAARFCKDSRFELMCRPWPSPQPRQNEPGSGAQRRIHALHGSAQSQR